MLRTAREVVRAPIFADPRTPLQMALDLWEPVQVHGAPFLIRELVGVLGSDELVVLTFICSRYLAGNGPGKPKRVPGYRLVDISLTEVATDWLGWKGKGGVQTRKVRDILARLRRATFESVVRTGAGETLTDRFQIWGLIDGAEGVTVGRGRTFVRLSPVLGDWLDRDEVVHLAPAILARLHRASPTAMRLWMYLEAETLNDVRQYAVFSAPMGEPARPRENPAIADLLRLSTTAPRRNIASDLRTLCRIIEREDGHYRGRLSVDRAKAGGSTWNLVARPGPRRRTATDEG